MLKMCRNRRELYTKDSLPEIDAKLREYRLLVKEHLVPLPGVSKSEQKNPKWHVQVWPDAPCQQGYIMHGMQKHMTLSYGLP